MSGCLGKGKDRAWFKNHSLQSKKVGIKAAWVIIKYLQYNCDSFFFNLSIRLFGAFALIDNTM